MDTYRQIQEEGKYVRKTAGGGERSILSDGGGGSSGRIKGELRRSGDRLAFNLQSSDGVKKRRVLLRLPLI